MTTAHAASILALAAVWPIDIATRQGWEKTNNSGQAELRAMNCGLCTPLGLDFVCLSIFIYIHIYLYLYIYIYIISNYLFIYLFMIDHGFGFDPIVLSAYTFPVVSVGVWRIGSLRRPFFAFFSPLNFAGEF